MTAPAVHSYTGTMMDLSNESKNWVYGGRTMGKVIDVLNSTYSSHHISFSKRRN
jgi:hypothetical protein